MTNQVLDQKNRSFWKELCGTHLANAIGVTEQDPHSLRKFDDAYFEMYSYLYNYVPKDEIRGKKVLEIGLGYGTLGQYLAECGALYHGLDIAEEPVEMMRLRLGTLGIHEPERIQAGSALDIPHPDETFDYVYSIGCLHHTGNLARGIDEVHRVLKPGGSAYVMIYNGRSLRQILTRFRRATRVFTRGKSKYSTYDEEMRAMYDANVEGDACPHTDFTSKPQVKKLFSNFRSIRVEKRNADPMRLWNGKYIPREKLLSTVGRLLGLDLYIHAEKKLAHADKKHAHVERTHAVKRAA